MLEELRKKARWLRKEMLEMTATTGKGHIGSVYSCVELLVALYYGKILRYKPNCPKWPDRDRFIVGKGHISLALYMIWANLGFLDPSSFKKFGSNGADLGTQLNIDTPGVDYNTGSLGHAIGIAAGMALAAKMNKQSYRSFALVGDGECAEGSIWESLAFASEYKLDNLIGIIDRNGLNMLSLTERDGYSHLENKVRGFGWEYRIIDGHSLEHILQAFNGITGLDRPLMIIADTVKGKGISFMEMNPKWHDSPLTSEELEQARRELKDVY